MEQELHRAWERTKAKQKQNQVMSHSNQPRVLFFDLAHKQCNGIIKGWLHCLTSESKGRFLVNNILIFGSAWCLVMAQIQFFQKNKDWTSRTLGPITSHFCLTSIRLFDFNFVSSDGTSKIITCLDSTKDTSGVIPTKIVKLANKEICKDLANFINESIKKNAFPNELKAAVLHI